MRSVQISSEHGSKRECRECRIRREARFSKLDGEGSSSVSRSIEGLPDPTELRVLRLPLIEKARHSAQKSAGRLPVPALPLGQSARVDADLRRRLLLETEQEHQGEEDSLGCAGLIRIV